MRRKTENRELGRLSTTGYRNTPKTPLIIVLDNIRSLNNTGSIFRIADAFRCQEIYLCGITACPPHREIHKTALGATESVAWRYFASPLDAIIKLKEDEYKIFGLEQTDDSRYLHQFSESGIEKAAVVLGNEIHGLSEEILNLMDMCLEIPQFGTKHSLNVAVSAGIVIWHFYDHFPMFKNLRTLRRSG